MEHYVKDHKSNSNSVKENSECLEKEEKEFMLNLAVFGTSVPVSTKQLKNPKVEKKYKSRQYPKLKIKDMESNLPVDKIVFLAERLELTDQKIEFVTSSMEASKSQTKGHREYDFFAISEESLLCSKNKTSSRRTFKERSALLSPDNNFSIDLSSLAGTNDESDESYHDLEDSINNEESKSCRKVKTFHERKMEVCKSREPCVTPKREPSTCNICCNDSTLTTETKSSDPISHYVNGIGDPDSLTKYLRPRQSFDNLYKSSDREGSLGYFRSQAYENQAMPSSAKTISRAIETEESISRFESQFSCPLPYPKSGPIGFDLCCSVCCPSFPITNNALFEDDERSGICGKKSACECEFDWANNLEHSESDYQSERMLTYASSLANAARSARVLARDLESVLTTFRIETNTNRE